MKHRCEWPQLATLEWLRRTTACIGSDVETTRALSRLIRIFRLASDPDGFGTAPPETNSFRLVLYEYPAGAGCEAFVVFSTMRMAYVKASNISSSPFITRTRAAPPRPRWSNSFKSSDDWSP